MPITNIEILKFVKVASTNTFIGYVSFKYMGLTIHSVKVFKNNTEISVGLPAIPYKDAKTNETKFAPVIWADTDVYRKLVKAVEIYISRG